MKPNKLPARDLETVKPWGGLMANETGISATADGEHELLGACFDLVDALDGVFVLEKRSATLDGSVPVRAARGCVPFLAGNQAGFQLRPGERVLVRLGGDEIEVLVPARFMDAVGAGYDDRVERLIAAGLLVRDGHWHQTLSQGIVWRDGDRVCLWTGLLVRVASHTRVLVTGAFNRRVRASVQDYVIAEESAFVPVIVELAESSFSDGELMIAAELACLLPIRTAVQFEVCPLEDDPGVGEDLIRFHSDAYSQKRAVTGNVGDYRRLISGELDDRFDPGGRCRLVFAGPNPNTIETFDRFATSAGVSDTDPSGHKLDFAVLRSIGRVRARCDGATVTDVSFDAQDAIARFRQQWSDLYGPAGDRQFENLARYAFVTAPPRREPLLGLMPWVFLRTPPGWSSVIDGSHHEMADGLRGVISTDAFRHIASPVQFVKPASITIDSGQPLMRVLPVPRALLRAPFCSLTITEAAT